MDNLGYVVIETATTSSDIMPAKILEKRPDGRVMAEGVLQEANMKNRNGRFYDSRDLFPELVAPRQLELLQTGNMRGENGHPLSKDLVRQQTIDPNNCVCIYTKFWTDGDFVMGNFFGTFNQLGEEFNKELLAGMSPSFSLRALGGIDMRNGKAYVTNVKLITYDRVIYPSHKVAYTEKIVSEAALLDAAQKQLKNLSEEAVKRAKEAQTKLIVTEDYKGLLAPITNESVIRALQHESGNVKSLLENFDIRYNNVEIIPTVSGFKVQMMDEAGNVIVANLEKHINDEIMNYCINNYI